MLLLYQIINREGCEINISAIVVTDMFYDQDKYEKCVFMYINI